MSTDPLLAAIEHVIRLRSVGPAAPEEIPCGPPVGLFEGTTDIGEGQPGSVLFKPHAGTYRISGGGADVGGASDAFHFAWRRLFGNGTWTTDVHFSPGPRSSQQKALLLFRQSLEPASPYAAAVLHGDGRVALQYRQAAGAATFRIVATLHSATTLSLERFGGLISAAVRTSGSAMRPVARIVLPLHDPLYAGLGVCGGDPEATAAVTFSGVRHT